MEKGSENYIIREIEAKDDELIESIIRSCLIEFGGDREGTAWTDPDLSRFSEVYDGEEEAYWVVEDGGAKVLGGVGIGCLDKDKKICELQKMYLVPQARGRGLAQELLAIALEFASKHYKQCYLETLDNMEAAKKFYSKSGFKRINYSPVETPHFSCEVRFIIDL